MNNGAGVYGMPGMTVEQLKALGGANDPAFAIPSENAAATRPRSMRVYRDLSLATIQNTWTVDQARGALYAHMQGIFENSSQLWDSIIADPRVMATLGSRITGLFGREVRFRAADDSLAAKEVLEAWRKAWLRLSGDGSMRIVGKTRIGMGFAPAQIVWDTSEDVWCPYLRPWHTRYTYYDWSARRLIALSQDGPIVIEPGDAKWFLLGTEYRSWIYGAIRGVTEPWMLRHFAARDIARFSEVHGLPTRKGIVPAVCDPVERSAFEEALGRVGSDTAMIVPRGVDGQNNDGYDYELVEARDTAWESFPGLIDRCDMAIILALLFQNLTTEVKGGSFAAASAHMDIRQSGLQGDDAEWSDAILNQLARPFAWLNFGDASLAPFTCRDVEARDDTEHRAKQFMQFGSAVEGLARGGVEFLDTEELRRFAAKNFGLDQVPDFTIGDPPTSGGGMGGFGK